MGVIIMGSFMDYLCIFIEYKDARCLIDAKNWDNRLHMLTGKWIYAPGYKLDSLTRLCKVRALAVFCLLLIGLTPFKTYTQNNNGLPIWPLAISGSGNAQTIDWRTVPPVIADIPNTAPSSHGSTAAAFNGCGDLVFYVIHTGLANTPYNLYLYRPDGTALLNNSLPNGPGLNGKGGSTELNVVQVPGHGNRWYIIYCEWKTDVGALGNNGIYEPSAVLYSLVEYDGIDLTVIQRDIPLTVNGTTHTYAVGKAVSRTAGNPNQHYLYLCRKSKNYDYLSLDRFVISSNGIQFNANTGNVSAPWWSLTILGTYIELSPTEDRVAVLNRNGASNNPDIYIFNTQTFSNAPAAHQSISLGNLILQPDNVVNFTAQSITQTAQTNPNLAFLTNLEKKILDLEFSPNGRFLYFCNGGYVASAITNITYLGQIDLGPVSQPASYPYNVRLQVQRPPGVLNMSTGAGGAFSGYFNLWNSIEELQSSYDGKIYFTKDHSDTLYVIPNPDQFMPQMLTPGTVNLSDPTNPNLIMNGQVRFLPDQIDGFDYVTSVPMPLELGNDTLICAIPGFELNAGSGFLTYQWQDGSGDSTCLVTQTGMYHIMAIDSHGCISRDTVMVTVYQAVIDVSSDTVICPGDTVELSVSPASSYLWSTGSTASTITVSPLANTTYYVTVTDSICMGSDSIIISIFSPPNFDFYAVPQEGCVPVTVAFFCPSDSIVSHSWYFGDGSSDTSANPVHTYTAPGIYTVLMHGESIHGCPVSKQKPDYIEVYPLPVAAFTYSGSLVGFPGELVHFHDLSSGANAWVWDFGDSIGTSVIQNPAYAYSQVGQYTVWLYVESQYGCRDSVSNTLNVGYQCSVYIPNAFTPDGDGVNDSFGPIGFGLERYDYVMRIFNRWGQMVFHTNDVLEHWNGCFHGTGQPLPKDVYTYSIRIDGLPEDCGSDRYVGHVVLVR